MPTLTENQEPLTLCEMEHLQPDLLFLSLAITTFYRKSFTLKNHGSLIFISLLSFLSFQLDISMVLIYVLVISVICDVLSRILTYNLQDVFNNIVVYLSLLFLSHYEGEQLWMIILILSPAQLIRYARQ